jgi:hypothetical protein
VKKFPSSREKNVKLLRLGRTGSKVGMEVAREPTDKSMSVLGLQPMHTSTTSRRAHFNDQQESK